MVEILSQMKPYGRLKTIKFPSKMDNHIRKNNKKLKIGGGGL